MYYFPTPITDEEAVEEVAWLIKKIKGLDLCMPVLIDSENVLTDRTGRADKLSLSTRTHLLRVITDHLLADGYPCGIYSYTNWLANNVDLSKLDPQVVKNTWVAQPGKLEYKGTVALWQYGKKKFSWTAAEVDVNKIVGGFDMSARKKEETVAYYRQTIIDKAKTYLGATTGSAKHKEILAAYNGQKSLPRGVKMTTSMPWCATFVSAIAVLCDYTSIIPTECSCPQMINLAKKKGIWVENDSYKPSIGDIILYDWQDSGKGDNTGEADHIGYVESVSGNTMTILEGNMGNEAKVGRRTLQVNGKYIRGFITPKYTAVAPRVTAKDKKVELTITLPEIHLYDAGEHVKFWQWLIGINQTGEYGKPSQDATKEWQKKNGKAVDGWVGKGCWTKALKNKGWM